VRNTSPSCLVYIGRNLVKSSSAAQARNPNAPEVRLIQKAVSGDADAFARLYDAHIDEVFRFIFYRVHDQQTAEDLTSQVFLKAWDNLSGYELRGRPFKAWLLQIARNSVIDHYRTRKDIVPLEPNAMSRPDPGANVSRQVEQRLQGEWLRAKLEHLTEDQRDVLILKFIHGLSTKEVAEFTGRKEGAVRALQMRGLQALADLIDDETMALMM